MSDASYTAEDLQLFGDLIQVAEDSGVAPCLIGAGAIQLGADLQWGSRLGRTTRDWDFAIRIESWSQYEDLALRLVSDAGGFMKAPEPHRFRHRAGGVLDVLPYGGLEHPPGTIHWHDGHRMDTTGLVVLEEEHEQIQLEHIAIQVASRPAILGLKLLAYRDRRPAITRDIVDVHALLRDAEESVTHERVAEEALERLSAEELSFSEVGAYLLGRDVGRAFSNEARQPMQELLQHVGLPDDRTIGDIAHTADGGSLSREVIRGRMRALAMGIADAWLLPEQGRASDGEV